MKEKLLRSFVVAKNEVNGFVKNKAADVLKTDGGEAYVDTGVKIVIAIVIGSLLLVGLIALMGDNVLPMITDSITDMFGNATVTP